LDALVADRAYRNTPLWQIDHTPLAPLPSTVGSRAPWLVDRQRRRDEEHQQRGTLRHTAATYLLSLDVHPRAVQDKLGHSSIALTLNTYSHVVPALHREAAGQMERLFSGPADAPDGPVDARDGISSLGHPDAV
jgi:integrase